MNKAGRTRDELIKQFSQTGAPEGNHFPSAASGPYQTKAANAPTGEETFPFPGRDVEYRPSASSLPMSVSAAQVKRDNCDRGNMPWDSELRTRPFSRARAAVRLPPHPSLTNSARTLLRVMFAALPRELAKPSARWVPLLAALSAVPWESCSWAVGALAGGGLGSSIGAVPGEAIKSLAEAGEE